MYMENKGKKKKSRRYMRGPKWRRAIRRPVVVEGVEGDGGDKNYLSLGRILSEGLSGEGEGAMFDSLQMDVS